MNNVPEKDACGVTGFPLQVASTASKIKEPMHRRLFLLLCITFLQVAEQLSQNNSSEQQFKSQMLGWLSTQAIVQHHVYIQDTLLQNIKKKSITE